MTVLALAACTPTPAEVSGEEWRLSIVSSGASYPMKLVGDTVGGAWGMSGGAWVHVNAEGSVSNRFQDEIMPSPWKVTAFDAVTPDVFAVGAVWADGDLFGDILLFDASSRTPSVLFHAERPVGDLAATPDQIFFVSYDASDDRAFDVSHVDTRTGAVSPFASVSGAGRTASIDVDSSGAVHVATESGRTVVSPAGDVIARDEEQAADPRIAVSPSGRVLRVSDAEDGVTPGAVAGDSRAFTESSSGRDACAERWLLVEGGQTQSRIEAPCDIAGFAWLDDETFLVSAGDESRSVMVKVRPPRTFP